jgi:hypothetical protein
VWRPDDEALLQRLEDEEVLARLFQHHAGPASGLAARSPRAAGLVASARALPGATDAIGAARTGDAAPLARLLEAAPMSARPPELLHHLALYFGSVARALEAIAPDAAANAWTRALAAWLALGEERAYIMRLEAAILGPKDRDVAIPPERVPLETVDELGRRAEAAARDLAPSGRAALLALAWVADAARLAGASDDATARVAQAAERRRNAALDAALAVVGEALDDANVRGDLTTSARGILVRAVDVWAWSGNDEAAEHFAVDRLATVGWELYRARRWADLRQLLEPFRGLIEHLAARIERDPTKLAYAAPCAQMFVFLSDVETHAPRKRELAERAVHVCPTHRNGRLVLAAILCEDAQTAMRAMPLFARKSEIARVEALLARAEQLYPQSGDLAPAKAMLERVKKGRIAI